MNYLMLAAVAFCFCLLGFIFHALFFNKKKRVNSLLSSNRALREDLRDKEKIALDMRNEIDRLKKHIDMLEHQVQRRNIELNDLYHGTLRREEPLWRKKLNTLLDVLREIEK